MGVDCVVVVVDSDIDIVSDSQGVEETGDEMRNGVREDESIIPSTHSKPHIQRYDTIYHIRYTI